MNKVLIDRELLERVAESLQLAVDWEKTGRGRPPSQSGYFEREELRAALAAPKVAPEQVEAAWRAGWAACRDAEYVGQEAEDETWSMSETCANADWENAAPKAAQPLTVEAYTAIAHRTASKYAHRSDPAHVVYTFFPHTLDDFVRKIEAAIGGQQPLTAKELVLMNEKHVHESEQARAIGGQQP